ncbi:ribosomal-processing cysteine protease Prp [Vallitalea okinawensis]|uniref:ribosomal-processing cysteine protease Prp n=1 Tax=Vallitalea okinawensis TaxID=2078660 RepID=UPI000CFC1E3D|nr:ribosomal-processing cysteine protease Prp [Vallitalea okinawensis]
MIHVKFYQTQEEIIGVEVSGHAEYAEYGQDIVCAAVSALVFNSINSVDEFTDDSYELENNEQTGYINFLLKENISLESKLLIKSLHLGLIGISAEYGEKYIKVSVKEV